MVSKNLGEALSKETAVMRSLAKEIGGLKDLGLAQLRVRYGEVFGEEPRSKNLSFLRKKIAFRLQEQMEGGLSEAAQNRIQELVPLEMEPKPKVKRAEALASRLVQRFEGRDSRLPKSGSLISREYRGFVHEVLVMEDTFLYRGRAYRSLSAIAKEITGTPWNGFLFFGLTKRGDCDARQG